MNNEAAAAAGPKNEDDASSISTVTEHSKSTPSPKSTPEKNPAVIPPPSDEL